MNATVKKLPVWILIISGIFALMEIMVSASLCFSPESVIETVDLKTKGVDFLVYIWASRQFALGIIFGFATLKKSIPMLTLAYIFFFVMFIGDLLIGWKQNEVSLIVAGLAMSTLSLVLIFLINRKK